jgi:uncharacterized protein (UPF0212 family)
MNRQQAMQKAWNKWQQKQEYGTVACPEPSEEFDYAFVAAWVALLEEVGPLVADLTTIPRGATRHIIAVERLRDLVRE